MYLVDFVICFTISPPHTHTHAICGSVAAACGASAPSKKTRPWIFGVCILWILSFFNDLGIQQMLRSVKLVFFAGFRVSQPCASVWWLPAALRRPQKKHAPGFLEHASCGFCNVLTISGPLKPFAAVSQLPAALRLPQKKHASVFLEYVSCGCCHLLTISVSNKC